MNRDVTTKSEEHDAQEESDTEIVKYFVNFVPFVIFVVYR